jgi:hypothetical protein
VREIGTAFGIALLGTVMNRAYQDHFDTSPTVTAIRADPAQAPLQPVLDAIGSGAGVAGRVVEDPQLFPGLPAAVAFQLREVSAEAFMAGMDRAVIVATATMVVAALIALLTIKDRVVSGLAPVVVEDEEEAPALLAGAAD